MRNLVFGEILWDVFEDGERLGGAPFNFAAQLARLGHQPRLVSAVGEDDRGRRALEQGGKLGVGLDLTRTTGAEETGVVRVRLENGQPEYEIKRPAAYDFADLTDEQLDDIAQRPPDWIYFGTLFPYQAGPRALLERVFAALPDTPRFYDVNLRPNSYSAELLLALLPHASALKVNHEEVRELERIAGDPDEGEEAFARRFARRYGYQGVCVTRGGDGCALLWDGDWVEAPGVDVTVRDAVGAGDAFTAALLHGVANGWELDKRADLANRVGALIASKSGATPEWDEAEAWAL